MLVLEDNGFEGQLPTVLPKSMRSLYLNRNRLTGTISANIFSSSALYLLDASQNQISGTLPNIPIQTGVHVLLLHGNNSRDDSAECRTAGKSRLIGQYAFRKRTSISVKFIEGLSPH